MQKKHTIGVISLGCDKNRVDTEKMLGILQGDYDISSNLEDADLIIINTCAFLQKARQEAIEEILWAIGLKALKPSLKIVVTGCLPQKFIEEIYPELIEVDAFLGISDYDKLPEVLNRVFKGERVNAVGIPKGEPTTKRILTTKNYAYLKIADGCSNHCTYCLIPAIRGKYRSVSKQYLLQEVEGLGKVQELILVAQDTTSYGLDLTPKTDLVDLIREISKLDTICHIRLLYCYPERITDKLIEEIKTNPKIIKYLDIPLQHADEKVLKLMNRKGTGQGYLALIERLRKEIPEIVIRSTFITGFPGEDEEAFCNLVEFIKKAKLFNAGFFAYSKEQGTPAYKLPNQVLVRVKNSRLKTLYREQKKIVKENLKTLIGQTVKVIAEGFDENSLTYYGRAYFNAPDIDGKVYFFSGEEIEYGSIYEVKVKTFSDYDLYGEKI